MRVTRRVLLTAALLLCVSLSASPVRAQVEDDVDTGGLDIEAMVGWDGVVDSSGPMPISLMISNFSGKDIDARLVLNDPYNGYRVSLGDIYISNEATRRFTVIQALPDWYHCTATLTDGETVFWRRELVLSTGREFVDEINYLLFVDDSGRNLQLPGAEADTSIFGRRYAPAGGMGKPVELLNVKSWQLPRHPGPLTPAQAIVLPEDIDPEKLNDVQWRAMAEWVCLGGTLFVHEQSEDILERLTAASPLVPVPADEQNGFFVRRAGAGTIRLYAQPMMTSDGAGERQRIAEAVTQLTKYHALSVLDSSRVNQMHDGTADRNRFLVVAFFALYTLMSGVVTLVLFRLSRRRIAIFIVCVVGSASVLSGLLGGSLRYSKGDLRWTTVTQAGAGGLVQLGEIEVQSAGGRNTQVAVTGASPDLQHIESNRPRYHRYYWHYSRTLRTSQYPAFTWQDDLAKDDQDTYEISVPMTPWGERQLLAKAFRADVSELQVRLTHTPSAAGIVGDATTPEFRFSTPADGEYSVDLVNPLPFPLDDCWLILGLPQLVTTDENSNRQTVRIINNNVITYVDESSDASGEPRLADIYMMSQLGAIEAGGRVTAPLHFQQPVLGDDRDRQRSWDEGSALPPQVSFPGTVGVWILARLESSPILQIDESRTDFVPQDELHLYLQELPLADLPESLRARIVLSTADIPQPTE